MMPINTNIKTNERSAQVGDGMSIVCDMDRFGLCRICRRKRAELAQLEDLKKTKNKPANKEVSR